jgi:hypothetical protein
MNKQESVSSVLISIEGVRKMRNALLIIESVLDNVPVKHKAMIVL